MLSAKEAVALILESVRPLPAVRVPFREAARRVLAEDLVAREDYPPFDNSAMDGFAVRLADVGSATPEAPVTLQLGGEVPAGHDPRAELAPGQAVPIMTGAPIPAGTEAVVMKERAERAGAKVRILRSAREREHIRSRGEDIRKGDALLAKGTLLRPGEVALLAAQGIAEVALIGRPRAAIIPTGDELTDGAAPGPAGIRNCNGPALAAAVRRWDCEALEHPPVNDSPELLERAFGDALAAADALLITGGVSVGAHDHTRRTLERLGAREIFWKVSIKPGKPLYFGVLGGKPVFGLPGNPVAALVCVDEFVRPALEKMQGRTAAPPSYHMSGKADKAYPLKDGRRHHLFCVAHGREDGFHLEIIRPQGSARIAMAVRANALAIAENGPRKVEAGESLPFRWIK